MATTSSLCMWSQKDSYIYMCIICTYCIHVIGWGQWAMWARYVPLCTYDASLKLCIIQCTLLHTFYMYLYFWKHIVCYFLVLIIQRGETAVMLAAYWGKSESLQLLLEANANLNLQNNVSLLCLHVRMSCVNGIDKNPKYSYITQLKFYSVRQKNVSNLVPFCSMNT